MRYFFFLYSGGRWSVYAWEVHIHSSCIFLYNVHVCYGNDQQRFVRMFLFSESCFFSNTFGLVLFCPRHNHAILALLRISHTESFLVFFLLLHFRFPEHCVREGGGLTGFAHDDGDGGRHQQRWRYRNESEEGRQRKKRQNKEEKKEEEIDKIKF